MTITAESIVLGEVRSHVKELSDFIREIERETKRACQLEVNIENYRIVIGALTQREGKYFLRMNSTYVDPSGKRKRNYHKELEGEYESFSKLSEAIYLQSMTAKVDFKLKNVPGKVVPIVDINHWKIEVGELECPLLGENETAKVYYEIIRVSPLKFFRESK